MRALTTLESGSLRSGSSPRWLLAASALLLILWSLAVPVFEAPDEPVHWQYARYLHDQKTLPRFGPQFAEANQPPLYYLLIAPFALSSDVPASSAYMDSGGVLMSSSPPSFYRHTAGELGKYWPLRMGRLVTCMISVLTVYVAYLSGVAATGSPSTGLLAGGLVAFLPLFTFRGATISNDALVALTSAAAVYVIIRLITRGYTRRESLLGAVAITVALLSKINTIFLPLPFALALLSERVPWRLRLGRLSALGVTALLVAPWFVRNAVLYGDPLASAAMWTVGPDLVIPKSITAPYFRSDFPTTLLRSLVGIFGWMNLSMPEWVYAFFAALALLGTMGCGWRVARRAADRRLMAVLISIPVLALTMVVWFNLTFSQPQGRYLYPALTTIAVLLALGLEALPWWGPRWTLATIVCLGAINAAVLGGTIVPSYATARENLALQEEDGVPPPATDKHPLQRLYKYYRFRLPTPPTDVRMTAGPLFPGVRYAQSFVAEKDDLSKVDLEFAMYGTYPRTGVLHVHLRSRLDDANAGDIASVGVPLFTVYDHPVVPLRFAPIPDSGGKTYYIAFEAPDRSPLITVWLRNGDAQPDARFLVDGKPSTESTYFHAFYGADASHRP